MYVVGIDVGSLATKAVIIDGNRTIIGWKISPTGIMNEQSLQTCLDGVLKVTGMKESDVDLMISTGYGRRRVAKANREVTEITCHARGMHFLCADAHTIIDIGGQDSKVISVVDNGRVHNFEMNDKCAAGSGRFLEVMARGLGVGLEDMGEMSLQATQMVDISSTCTVFAETEVISLLASGCALTDILSGIHYAIARRVAAMVKHVGVKQVVVMSGGVAKNIGVVSALEDLLQTSIFVPPEPQVAGALGAALIALDDVSKISS